MDIALAWDAARARGDWSNASGSDLETAVLISLFTDRVLPSDQVPPDGSNDRRGWWADTYRGQPIGSRLWTLYRAVKSNATATLAEAKDMCLEALNWLVTDGVAASVQVRTFWVTATQLGIIINVTEPAGTVSTFQYAYAWQGIS